MLGDACLYPQREKRLRTEKEVVKMAVLADEEKEGMGVAKFQRRQKNVTILFLQFHHDNLQKNH